MKDEEVRTTARALADQGIDAVYCVNLRRRGDRRRFMRYKLDDVGLHSVSFWPATDGRTKAHRAMFEDYKARCANDFGDYPVGITPGAFGLILTWRALVDDILGSGAERALVLEDDVYFHRRFAERLTDEVPRDASVVYLGGHQDWRCEVQQAAIDAGRSCFPVTASRPTWGTYAIVIRRAFAQELMSSVLSQPSRWDAPLDWFVWRTLVEYPQYRGVVAHPSLVIPEVRDSDNMGPRDIVSFAQSRGISLDDYRAIGLYPPVAGSRVVGPGRPANSIAAGAEGFGAAAAPEPVAVAGVGNAIVID